jgi:hypothetical protein
MLSFIGRLVTPNVVQRDNPNNSARKQDRADQSNTQQGCYSIDSESDLPIT